MATITPRSRPRNSSLLAPLAATLAATLAASLAASLSGCGGGGSGAAATGAELSFSVAWEQPASDARGSERVFDTPIPPSVSAIRFTFRPPNTADACCLVIRRGSQAFIDRHIVLANVPVGLGTLQVTGFPTTFAPADGVTAVCPTRPLGQGDPCSGNPNTLPSFGSDEVEVDVLPAQQNVASVDVYSLPFLLGLSPEDGGTAESARPDVDFTVVDANHFIASDVNIRIKDGAVTDFPDILTTEECLDGDSALPDCSQGGLLEVHGLIVTSRATQPLPQGTAQLRIQASNVADPVRSMESNTTFNIDVVTTTTSTSSTTSTTLPPQTYCLKFSLTDATDLVGISYDFHYLNEGGQIVGSGEDVPCSILLDSNPDTTLVSFNDDDGSSTLSTAIVTATKFAGPTALATCEFRSSPPLRLNNTSVVVTEATAPDLSPANVNVVVEEIPCP